MNEYDEKERKINEAQDKQKVNQIREAFNVFDKDNDGYITLKELGTVMRSLGQNPSEQELQELIRKYDRDESGTIDFTEFFDLMYKKMEETEMEQEFMEIFEALDRDGNGLLSGSEIQSVMQLVGVHLTDEQVSELIKQADLDEDGCLNFPEFFRMMSFNES